VSCSDTMLAPASVGFNQTLAVVVPTFNAAKLWSGFNEGLRRQGLEPQQILIVDSSSTDGTPELARAAGYRVLSIARSEFNHGGTRQAAAELLQPVDILVYLTQDSILADANALARLTAAFEDPSIGAAYGRQLRRPGANSIEAHARLFNYPAASAIRSLESAAAMGFKAIFFSNSFGAYRRLALEQAGGFPRESNFGEDTVVAARLLQSSWRIAYVAEAQAYHSHAHSCREEFQRYYRIGRLHGSEPWLLRDFGKASGEGRRFVVSEIRYLSSHAPWLIPEAMLRTGLKYLGYKRGRASMVLPRLDG
jgi:rhamnosyltransferase